ncbi:MAG: TRAP transporter small permease, partial [Desulfohalobiaceae bacterium]|nr:TRAP transporter small permease [Desulfohalobiaceae bacterium]
MSNSSQKNKHSPNGSGLPGRLFDRLNTGLAVLAGLILLFMTFSISSSILARALEVPFPVWVVQFNEYGLLWMTFLATAWVLKRDKHVSIDLLTGKLPTLANRTLAVVQNLVCGAFCAVLFWHSLSVTWDHFQRGIIDVKGVDVPKYLILVVIPVGFLLLTLQFFRNVYTFL